jgi:phosphoglycolate phosphatase
LTFELQTSRFRLVVFDLDGTLVDSRADLANATNALVESLGAARLADDRITAMVGEGAATLVRRALEAASLDPATPGALERFLELYDERLLEHTRPYPGMPDTLGRIKAAGIAMAVLTNKPSAATRRLLEGLDLGRYFIQIVGGDTPFGRKPDPAGLLHLVDVCRATPETTLMVGDSAIDWRTARHAGVRICLARYGFGYRFDQSELSGAEIVIDHPSELAKLL